MEYPSPVDPHDAATPQQFIECMRRLKIQADLSYRRLAANARAAGRDLPYSTIATVLNGENLPRMEFVAAFVQACGCDDQVADAWIEARRRLAIEQGRPAPPEPPPLDALVPYPAPREGPVETQESPAVPPAEPARDTGPTPLDLWPLPGRPPKSGPPEEEWSPEPDERLDERPPERPLPPPPPSAFLPRASLRRARPRRRQTAVVVLALTPLPMMLSILLPNSADDRSPLPGLPRPPARTAPPTTEGPSTSTPTMRGTEPTSPPRTRPATDPATSARPSATPSATPPAAPPATKNPTTPAVPPGWRPWSPPPATPEPEPTEPDLSGCQIEPYVICPAGG